MEITITLPIAITLSLMVISLVVGCAQHGQLKKRSAWATAGSFVTWLALLAWMGVF